MTRDRHVPRDRACARHLPAFPGPGRHHVLQPDHDGTHPALPADRRGALSCADDGDDGARGKLTLNPPPSPDRRAQALAYHAEGRPGKIQVVATKPTQNQRDLSLAYTPGVAEPCRAIQARPEDAYLYTARGNLVAVVSNGTAVLGLGDIGPLAGKPVMEGKAVLFKAFADLDVFDLEVNATDPEDVIRFCQMLEPTVGG